MNGIVGVGPVISGLRESMPPIHGGFMLAPGDLSPGEHSCHGVCIKLAEIGEFDGSESNIDEPGIPQSLDLLREIIRDICAEHCLVSGTGDFEQGNLAGGTKYFQVLPVVEKPAVTVGPEGSPPYSDNQFMDRGIPTEEQLEELRTSDPLESYLVGTPRAGVKRTRAL